MTRSTTITHSMKSWTCVCLVIFWAVTRANGDTHCSVDGSSCEMPCTSTNTNIFDDNDKLPAHSEGVSWFSDVYNGVADTFRSIKYSLSGEAYTETKYPGTIEDENNNINIEEMLAEANRLAATMASSHLNFNMKDIERFMAFTKHTEDDSEVERSDYEYKAVTRREATTVGEEINLDIGNGVSTKLIARALDPPLFEIPKFLSDEECDYIISKATEKGLHVSRLFLGQNVTEKNKNVDSTRLSESSVLETGDLGEEFLKRLQSRAARLANVPVEVVQWSEELAIGKYGIGGHYHAHRDSTDLNPDKVCCFQKRCSNHSGIDIINTDCCRLCRYATVLYYLNDVEEGGETAFPLADFTYSQIRARSDEMVWSNLTEHCYDSPVFIKPEKGKAILWYNHFVDKHGYLGGLSKRSYHGGCDVIQGTKWIATNWISIPTYTHRYVRSKHRRDKQ